MSGTIVREIQKQIQIIVNFDGQEHTTQSCSSAWNTRCTRCSACYHNRSTTFHKYVWLVICILCVCFQFVMFWWSNHCWGLTLPNAIGKHKNPTHPRFHRSCYKTYWKLIFGDISEAIREESNDPLVCLRWSKVLGIPRVELSCNADYVEHFYIEIKLKLNCIPRYRKVYMP